MSAGPLGSPSRRALLALMLWGGGAAARDPDRGVDRGLGGTGAAPADPSETLGQDRGIGGTGVVGTIRRFGSIVVNDLRVAFPPGVAVTIDGRPAAAGELRVGHVVRVLARRRAGRLVTRAIVAESEVVGPVDVVGPGRIVVLGQRVDLPEGVAVPPHGPGDRLAVSGLRRLDGVLVASLVERPPPGPDRLRGTVEASRGDGVSGAPSVGGLSISGLAPATVGRRVSLVGAREGGTFRPSEVRVEPRVPFAAADRLSLEAYVARAPDGLRLGSGLDLSARPSALAGLGEGAVRAVVLARPGPSGRLDAESLRIEAGSRGSGRGADHGPDRGAVGRGPGPGGATSPDGGHPGPGPRGDAGGPAAGNGAGSASGSAPASAPGGGAGGRGNGGGRGGGPGR